MRNRPPPPHCRFCKTSNTDYLPTGKIGLFGGWFGRWLEGEIGDNWWLFWLFERDCLKCNGTGTFVFKDDKPVLPPVPNPPAPPPVAQSSVLDFGVGTSVHRIKVGQMEIDAHAVSYEMRIDDRFGTPSIDVKLIGVPVPK